MISSILSKALPFGIVISIISAVFSVIYISNIYNSILTAMPLWMMIATIIAIWAVIIIGLTIGYIILKRKA